MFSNTEFFSITRILGDNTVPDERAKVRQFNWRKRQRNLKRKQVTYWLDIAVNSELNRLAREYGGPKQDAINAVLTDLLFKKRKFNALPEQQETIPSSSPQGEELVKIDETLSEWDKTRQLIKSMWPRKTYLQIAETLNRQNISTKTGRGRWHVSTVKRIIEQD
jgi:hypothetical protein